MIENEKKTVDMGCGSYSIRKEHVNILSSVFAIDYALSIYSLILMTLTIRSATQFLPLPFLLEDELCDELCLLEPVEDLEVLRLEDIFFL